MGTVRYAQGDCLDGPPVLAPDQQTFATVSKYADGQGRLVCLWDAATGKKLRHLHDPDFEHYEVFFLKRDNLLATVGWSLRPVKGQTHAYAIHFWDPATGKKTSLALQSPDCDFAPWALSPNEKWLASASRNPPVVVRELKTGRHLATWKGPAERVGRLAFSADGSRVAIACGKTIYLWDWQQDREKQRLGPFAEDVGKLWFSPDGKWLAGTVYQEGLRVWETAGFTEVLRLPEDDVRFLPDGGRLISMTTGVIHDVASGKEVGRFEDCQHCLALDFSRDGKTATGYALGRLRRWDAGTGKDRSLPAPAAGRVMIHQVGFLPDGKAVVSASPDGAVRLWDAATGQELRTLVPATTWENGKVPFLRVAAGGTIIVVRNKRLSFLPRDGAPAEFELTEFPSAPAGISVSPDGKRLVVAGGRAEQRLIQLWDVAGRKPLVRFEAPPQAHVESLALSPRGLAARVGDSVCLLSGRTGAVERVLDRRPEKPARGKGERRDDGGGFSWFPGVQALAFSPEGDLLATSGHPAGGLKLLDVFSGTVRHVLVPAPSGGHYELRNLAFSPDGQMLAAETAEGIVDVWETLTGQRRRRFLGHRSYQTALAFSPDGTRLATGNRDATILVWDLFGSQAGGLPEREPPTPAELETLWTRLADEDAERACLAMGRLLRCPGVSVPFLRQHLLGRKSPEAARLRGWLADLDSDDFSTRETASRELAARFRSAEPLLKEALAGNLSAEMRLRVERLLEQGRPTPPSPETLRDLRAIETLEHTGAGGDVLRELAEGNYLPHVVAAARNSRTRLAGKGP
jgi:WD40 repeat protein